MNTTNIPMPPSPRLNTKNNALKDLRTARETTTRKGTLEAKKTAKELYTQHQEYGKAALAHLKKVLGPNYSNFIQLFDNSWSSKLLGHKHLLVSYAVIFTLSFVFIGAASWALQDIFVGTAEMIVMFSLLSFVATFPKLMEALSPTKYKQLLEDLKAIVLEQDNEQAVQTVIDAFKNQQYNYQQQLTYFKREIDAQITLINDNTNNAEVSTAAFTKMQEICKNYQLTSFLLPQTKTSSLKKKVEIVAAVALCLPFFLLFLEPKDEEKVREGVGNFFAILGPALLYMLVNKIFNGTSNIENSLGISIAREATLAQQLCSAQQDLSTAQQTIDAFGQRITELETLLGQLPPTITTQQRRSSIGSSNLQNTF